MSAHVHSPYSDKMFRWKSWACHSARNDLTSTNVRNIFLCLPAYRHRGSWVTQVSTAEDVVTPPTPSCFDYSSYAAGITHAHTFPGYVWLPYITGSVGSPTEWLRPCLQSPLLQEIFQSITFLAVRFTSSSCQKNSSPSLDRVLVLHCFLGDRASATQKPYFRVWNSSYINLCFSISSDTVTRKTLQMHWRKTFVGEFQQHLLMHAHWSYPWENHCLAKCTSTSFSK